MQRSANQDGIILDAARGEIATEAKYIENSDFSEYNPVNGRPYKSDAVAEVVAQAVKYGQAYPAGVRWITNSPEFMAEYGPRFNLAGVRNFSFTIVPVVRVRP